MGTRYLGLDHVDVRVRSLAAVERFYDALLPELGLTKKTFAFVDAAGEWHEPGDGREYNTVEFHEEAAPGEPPRFIGIIEDVTMMPTQTRLAFAVAFKSEVVRWRTRLSELGVREIETEADFDSYPAVFFSDPAGTRLEICARNVKG